MRDLFLQCQDACLSERLWAPVDVYVEKWMNSLLYPSKQQRFNGLRFLFFIQYSMAVCTKKGIDNFRANLYLGFRRRLKGLAKLNFCRSEVG